MPLISLESLDLSKACETPVQFSPVGPDGAPIGIELLVLGGHAATVQNFVNKQINASRAKAAMDAKFARGKSADYTAIEKDIAFGIESVAVRIVGWSGLEQEYSPELAVKLCTINADICRQVREFSDDVANFTKG